MPFLLFFGVFSGSFPFFCHSQQPDHTGNDHQHHKAAGHNAVGEHSLVAMTLHPVLHVACTAHAAGIHQPEGYIPPLESPGLHHADREVHDGKQQCAGAQNLDDADEAIAAHEQGIVAGGVQHHLGGTVGAEPQGDGVAVPDFPPLTLLACQIEQQQNQGDGTGDNGLDQEGGEAPLHHAGNRIGHRVDDGQAPDGFDHRAPVGGGEEAGQTAYGDAHTAGQCHAVEGKGQIFHKAQQPQHQRSQDTAGKDAHQGITAAGKGGQSTLQRFIGIGHAVPVHGAGQEQGCCHGTGHQQRGTESVVLFPQVQEQEGADRCGNSKGQNDGAPVQEGLTINNRNSVHFSHSPSGIAVWKW